MKNYYDDNQPKDLSLQAKCYAANLQRDNLAEITKTVHSADKCASSTFLKNIVC